MMMCRHADQAAAV